MKIFQYAVPVFLAASPAFAGNVSATAPEPVPAPPPPPVATTGQWTGFYLGGQLGYGDVSVPGDSFDGGSAGVHAGYLYDLGTWVIGGELDYDWTNFEGATGEVDNIARAKLIGGYDLGQGLIYGTAGAFRANFAPTAGAEVDDNGAFIGLGYKHRFTPNIIGGVEALYHEASDFGGVAGNDLDATTLTARLSYKF